MLRLGEAATQVMAEKQVQMVIDRAIALEETLQLSRRKPPGGNA
jgi:hypothetical protein